MFFMPFKTFFDLDNRLKNINRMGDPLAEIDQVIAWGKFRPLLNRLREQNGNHTRSKTRSRVEHLFEIQSQMAGDLIVRTIGLARVKIKIGLRNLAYNMNRPTQSQTKINHPIKPPSS